MNAPVVWHAITGLLASTLLAVTNVNADQDLKGEGVVMVSSLDRNVCMRTAA